MTLDSASLRITKNTKLPSHSDRKPITALPLKKRPGEKNKMKIKIT